MPEVVLHRCRTPTNLLCPCGRVARELKRLDVPFAEEREPTRRRERTAVKRRTGQDRVPVLVWDGDAVWDSRRILEHLEWRAGGS